MEKKTRHLHIKHRISMPHRLYEDHQSMARGPEHHGGVSRRNISTRESAAKRHVFSLAYSLIELLRASRRPEELKSDWKTRLKWCPRTFMVVVAIAKRKVEALFIERVWRRGGRENAGGRGAIVLRRICDLAQARCCCFPGSSSSSFESLKDGSWKAHAEDGKYM